MRGVLAHQAPVDRHLGARRRRRDRGLPAREAVAPREPLLGLHAGRDLDRHDAGAGAVAQLDGMAAGRECLGERRLAQDQAVDGDLDAGRLRVDDQPALLLRRHVPPGGGERHAFEQRDEERCGQRPRPVDAEGTLRRDRRSGRHGAGLGLRCGLGPLRRAVHPRVRLRLERQDRRRRFGGVRREGLGDHRTRRRVGGWFGLPVGNGRALGGIGATRPGWQDLDGLARLPLDHRRGRRLGHRRERGGSRGGRLVRRGHRLHRARLFGRAAGRALLPAVAARPVLGGELGGFTRGTLGRLAGGGVPRRLFGGGASLAFGFHERGGFARGALRGMTLGGVALGAFGGGAGLAFGGGPGLPLGFGAGSVLERSPFGLGARDAFLLGGFGMLAGGAFGRDAAGGFELTAGVGVLRREIGEGALRRLAGRLFGRLAGGALGIGPLGRLTDGLLGGLQRDAVPGLALRRFEDGLLGQVARKLVGGLALAGLAGGALGGGPFGRFAGGPLLRFARDPLRGLAFGGFPLGTLGRFVRGPLRRGALRGFMRSQFGSLAGGPLGSGAFGRLLEGPLRGTRLAFGQFPRLALGRFARFRFPLGALRALGGFPFGAVRALRGLARRLLGGGTIGSFLLRALGMGACLALGLLASLALRGLAGVALARVLIAARLGGLLRRVALGLLAGPALGVVRRIPLETLAGLALGALAGRGVAGGALGGLPLGGFPRGAQRRFVRLPLGFVPRAPLGRFALGGGARMTLGRGTVCRFPRHLFGGVTRHLLRKRASFALGLFARLGVLPCAFRRLTGEAFAVVDRLGHDMGSRVVVDRVRGLLERRDVTRRGAHLVLQRLKGVDLVALAAAWLPGLGRRGPCLRIRLGLRVGPGLGVRLVSALVSVFVVRALAGGLISTASVAAGGGSAAARRRGAIVTCICIADSAESTSAVDFDGPPFSATATAGCALAISSS